MTLLDRILPPPPPPPPPPPLTAPVSASVEKTLASLRRGQEVADYAAYAEIKRIVRMPIYGELDENEYQTFCRENILVEAYDAGFRLFPVQAYAVASYEATGGLLGPIAVGAGKCVLGDTEIFDVLRGRSRADQGGALTTLSMDEKTGGLQYEAATSFPSGWKECLRMGVASGQNVGLSTDHPVFTPKGWVPAGQLKAGDLVAVPRHIPDPPTMLDLPDSHVRILANILSNGSTVQGRCQVVDMPGPLLDEFVADVISTGAECDIVPERSRAVCARTRKMLPFIHRYGVDECLSKNKRVPEQLYLLSHEKIALFLNRFWAADGHINKDGKALECTLASEGLIKDIQWLLLRLGIQARYGFKQASYSKNGERKFFDAWRLTITGQRNLLEFFSIVGSPLGQEQQSLDFLAKMSDTNNTNIDIVPISVKEISEICDEMGYPGRGGIRTGKGQPRTDLRRRLGVTEGQYISRDAFSSWVKGSGYSGKYAWLATNDIAWERVTEIRPLGSQPVYDLNVPETHNFIGNGIVLHNTAISLMIAEKAFRKGKERMLLIVPSQVLYQLTQVDIKWARTRVPISYPIHILGGKDRESRIALARSGRKGLYIIPYSLLSTQDTSLVLESIRPGIIIADEAHNLSRNTAARTKRVREYVDAHHPDYVALSGTITNKKIEDYLYHAKWALRDNNPMPNATMLAREWGMIIDAEASTAEGGPASISSGPLLPLIQWARRYFPGVEFPESLAGFRKAYKYRLNTAPGVVSSGDAGIGTSLILATRPVENHVKAPGFGDLQKLIDKVNYEWLTPNGDEIEHAIHTWKWLNELSAGFYNELTWPTDDAFAERRKLPAPEATEILEKAKFHHTTQQVYHRALRKWLEAEARAGLDTPMLVGGDIAKHGGKHVGDDLAQMWQDVRNAEFPGRPERDSRAVRVCTYKIDAMIKWAKEGVEGGIVWVHHQEVGKWAYEALIQAGVEAIHCPAGDRYNSLILDPASAKKIIVASISAHGVGKNLQHFQHQYVLQWPRSATVAEQMLGRTHRSGQKADELVVLLNQTLDFDTVNFAACLNDALYIHQTTGNRQKLIYANYDPLPKIYSSAWLHEHGANNARLTADMERILRERFAAE